MNILVLSSRSAPGHLADVNAYDFEDSVIDGAGADLHVIGGDRTALKPAYDLLIVCGISFHSVLDLVERVEAKGPLPPTGRRLAYVLGAYGHVVRQSKSPLHRLVRRLTGDRLRKFRLFDCVYLGIPDYAVDIETALGVPTRYLPMAANVLPVQARPYCSREDRPISVSAPGRQHAGIVNAICDRLNRPESTELALRFDAWTGSLNDLPRYRAMFWQVLRMSRVLMAFDHVYANPTGRNVLSHVGPRWFEALAAGTVVAGRGPATEEAGALLNWPDAFIDVDADPQTAAEEIAALVADEDRLRAASRRNLVEMHARHDWRHRLSSILEIEGFDRPARLHGQLQVLEAQAETLRSGGNLIRPIEVL